MINDAAAVIDQFAKDRNCAGCGDLQRNHAPDGQCLDQLGHFVAGPAEKIDARFAAAHYGHDLHPKPTSARDVQVGGDHYKRMGVQPWDVVDTWPREQRVGFYRGGALKYVMRLGTKDEEVGEAGKARHYLEKLIEVLGETA